jgi:myo-inositol-1(or 4)-monophosphatase
MKQLLVDCVRSAGAILLNYLGAVGEVSLKENQSSVVTQADLAAEKCIFEKIRAKFPDHGLIGEESGYQRRSSDLVWVVDPLDGTSNFVAGLPWFGVMVAVLEAGSPILAGMYLPCAGTLYLAEAGGGVERDGKPVRMTSETDLRKVLCTYAIDASADQATSRWQVEMITRLVGSVRNVRSTNCLLDLCYALEGRFGGCVLHSAKIWDIAPSVLMFPEAGGRFTELDGRDVQFRLDVEPHDRNYAVLGASQALHPQLLRVISATDSCAL